MEQTQIAHFSQKFFKLSISNFPCNKNQIAQFSQNILNSQ